MLRLKQLREEHHLNQNELAKKLKISQPTVSAFENGERTPDLATLIATAKLFYVSLDYLVGLSSIKQILQSSDLTAEEIDHLRRYSQLSKSDKEKVKSYIDGLESR